MPDADNLLQRLRQNRQRSAVPERDDPLLASTPELPSAAVDTTPQVSDNVSSTLEELQTELAKYPATRRRSGIVLEAQIDDELTQWCKLHKITPETFLEAAWELISQDRALCSQVLAQARKRYDRRKEAGQLRRLISLLSKQSS